MRNEDHWRYQVYRDRIKRSLADRYPVRRHMSIIVALAIAAGVCLDALLVAAGSRSMLSRHCAAIVAGHVAFIAGVHLWMKHSGVAQFIDRRKAHLLVGDDVAPPEPWNPRAGEEGEIVGDPVLLFYVLGILMAATVVFLTLGGWAVLVAPSIFGDAVLAKMHAAGLLKGVQGVEPRAWPATVLRHTGFSLAFGLVVAIAIGGYARLEAPGTNSLLDLF